MSTLEPHLACRSEEAIMQFEAELGSEEGNTRTRALLRSLSQVMQSIAAVLNDEHCDEVVKW